MKVKNSAQKWEHRKCWVNRSDYYCDYYQDINLSEAGE